MYPEWEPGMASGRSGGLLDTPNLSAGLLGPAPIPSAQTGGMSSSWGGGSGLSGKSQLGQNQLRSRVVVVKYDRKPLSNKTLFAFTEPFGILREHLVLKNKAFLEMSSHEAALDVVNYYEQHPTSLYGKPLTFYLSKRLMVIEKDERSSDGMMDRPVRDVNAQSSQVVFFSNLPREDEDKKELLTIAGRFGIVEKYLFLTHQAFVQLGTPEDAEMLVKYYSANPLSIKGRYIRFNICTKYKTLNVNRRQSGSGGEGRSQRSSTASSSFSNPGSRTSSNSQTPFSRSSSSSRSREERIKVEKKEPNPEEKPAVEKEEEEEVSGVMEGEDGGEERGEEQVGDVDAYREEPEREECVKETAEECEDVPQETVPDGADATDDSTQVGGAKAEAESEGPAGPTKTEDLNLEELNTEHGETSETVEGELSAGMAEQSFLENMEDFVTLDELAEDEDEGESSSIDNTRKGGMRVVNIVGFRRGFNFLNELLGLATPFGKVVRHLVLDLRPEAYLQFATEQEARAMATFYNSNVTASVCGRAVRVSHSMSYPTIQCGSSRVVYIGQIPSSKYSDEAVLKLAEPYGKIWKYFLNRIKRECFIEMEKAEDAEKMAESCKANPPKFNGKRLTVYVSRKYRQLKHGHRFPGAAKRERSSTPTPEPTAKKPKEEKQAEGEEEKWREDEDKQEKEEEELHCDVSSEEAREKASAEKIPEQIQTEEQEEQEEQEEELPANQDPEPEPVTAADNKASAACLPLPPYDPDTPIGVEHVKMGYYCRVCFLFYSNEDTAKKSHCSSRMHHDKLQKHLEKEQAKAEKKKTTV